MNRTLIVLILTALFQMLNAHPNLLEIIALQKKLTKSYGDVKKLQAEYNSKLQEAIKARNEHVIEDTESQFKDELTKYREQNSALELLNNYYAEQNEKLQNSLKEKDRQIKESLDSLKEKDLQIEQNLDTISVYTEIINKQDNQIKQLTEDLQIKSQIIVNMRAKEKETDDKFVNLEDLTTNTSTEIEESSCLSFGDSTEVHLIKVDDGEPFQVPCESQLSGPGWTVIQRRINGTIPFYRNWQEYKEGFGDLNGEFFIGLEKLHRMTSARPHELYIYMTKFGNESSFAHYDKILVAGESEQYALRELGVYSGTAGDSMRDNEHQKFSTLDRDNDRSQLDCAEVCLGGWWYNNCGLSNLNGQYSQADDYYDNSEHGIYWDEWLGPGYTMQSVQMLIRPKINTEK